MALHTYGFANEHSNLIGYKADQSRETARDWAREWLEQHPEATCVEVWRDGKDENGEPYPSFVVRREPEPCCGEFGSGSGQHGDECSHSEDALERIAREDSEREDACTACQLLGCSRGSMCGLRQIERQTEKSGRCECGEATGVRCDGVGVVTVEWMPVSLRAEHVEARNRGIYPHNGALRLFVTQTCAEMLTADGAEVVS